MSLVLPLLGLTAAYIPCATAGDPPAPFVSPAELGPDGDELGGLEDQTGFDLPEATDDATPELEAGAPSEAVVDSNRDRLGLWVGYLTGYSIQTRIGSDGRISHRGGKPFSYFTVCDDEGRPIRAGLFAYAVEDTAQWTHLRQQHTTAQWLGRGGLAVGIVSFIGTFVAAANDEPAVSGLLLLSSLAGFGISFGAPALNRSAQLHVARHYSESEVESLLDADPGPGAPPTLVAASDAIPRFYSRRVGGAGKCKDTPEWPLFSVPLAR